MYDINTQLKKVKRMLEDDIISRGEVGKTKLIRSSMLINLIHDAVKYELIKHGIKQENIFPHLGETTPELKIAGLLKQKKQDICVIPSGIEKEEQIINWGPMAFEKKTDIYGENFSRNTLVINVRSQLSSIAKNSDTLFERTFAEAGNLHMKYSDMVLGEVYLIPVFEYDDVAIKGKYVKFKDINIDLEKYISFFYSISGRKNIYDSIYKYERCALLIVDFSQQTPKLYNNSKELKLDNLISNDFKIEYGDISYNGFVKDLLNIYSTRFNIDNLTK